MAARMMDCGLDEMLPDELIFQILSYLPLCDRKNTRLLSKRWLKMNDDRFLTTEDVVVITDYLKLDEYVSPNLTSIFNVRIHVTQCIAQSQSSQHFWKQYGQNIKSVCVLFSVDCPKVILDISNLCPNLQECQVRSVFYKSCNCSVQKQNVRSLTKLFSLCVNVAVDGNLTVRAPAMLKQLINVISALTVKILLFHNVYLDSDVENFLRLQGPLLQKFSFCTYWETDEIFQIIDVLNSDLVAFEMREGSMANARSQINQMNCLARIQNKFRALKDISVISPSSELYASLLSNLTHASLSCFLSGLEDGAIDALASLPDLQCLELFHCYVAEEKIIKLFGSRLNSKFKSLKLSGSNISDDCIKKIVPNLPNIKSLHLRCSSLTESSLESIFLHCQQLQNLTLRPAPHISSFLVGSSVNALKDLIYLDFYIQRKLKTDFSSCLDTLKSLRLKKLKYLSLIGIPVFREINPKKLETLFSNCPSLQYVLYGERITEGDAIGTGVIVKAITRELKLEQVREWGATGWNMIPSFTKR